MSSRRADAHEANRAARAHLAVVLDAELEHFKGTEQRELDLRRGSAVELVRRRFRRMGHPAKQTG
jgi:hypothetical protein